VVTSHNKVDDIAKWLAILLEKGKERRSNCKINVFMINESLEKINALR
jgi:hypothetical protein